MRLAVAVTLAALCLMAFPPGPQAWAYSEEAETRFIPQQFQGVGAYQTEIEMGPGMYAFGVSIRGNTQPEFTVRVNNKMVVSEEVETWSGAAIIRVGEGTGRLKPGMATLSVEYTDGLWGVSITKVQ